MSQITLPTRLSDTCDMLIDWIIHLQITEKNHKNFIHRIISAHQMTCYVLPNHNAVKSVNRSYIEGGYVHFFILR